MKKFKVGDRVTARGNVDGYEGAGTIVEIDPEPRTNYSYLVQFDCVRGSKIWAYNDSVKHIERKPTQTIVIHQSGPITKAILKEGKTTIRTAEAKCSPHDTYDFATGARIAFDRLMVEDKPVEKPKTEPPKPEPVKLYCAKPLPDWLTVGKVYESVDGWMAVDNGQKFIDTVMRRNNYLFPLVNRPAKVGEWVYIIKHNGGPVNIGSVWKCTGRDCDTGSILLTDGYRATSGHYLVLDGYTGEDNL